MVTKHDYAASFEPVTVDVGYTCKCGWRCKAKGVPVSEYEGEALKLTGSATCHNCRRHTVVGAWKAVGGGHECGIFDSLSDD